MRIFGLDADALSSFIIALKNLIIILGHRKILIQDFQSQFKLGRSDFKGLRVSDQSFPSQAIVYIRPCVRPRSSAKAQRHSFLPRTPPLTHS